MSPSEQSQMQRLFASESLRFLLPEKDSTVLASIEDQMHSKALKKEGEENKCFFELATNQVNPKDIDKLNKDFDETFGVTMRKDGVYGFPIDEQATNFFKQQAEMNRSFLVKRTGEDSFIFSDGKGHFFKGSQDGLDNFLEAMQKHNESKVAGLSMFNSAKHEPQPTSNNNDDGYDGIYPPTH